jgi:predicted transcriptional regulator YdeE
MNTITVAPFYIIGMAVRTTNENEQAATDIPELWGRFMQQQIMAIIPGKVSNDIYCVYTDYEKDFMRPYTTVLGCKVDNIDNVPEGLVGKRIPGGTYTTFTAKGKLTDGIVYKAWTDIWAMDIARAYTADFEIYGEKAQNPNNAQVDIYIAVK